MPESNSDGTSSSNAEDHRFKWVEVRRRTRKLTRKNEIERIVTEILERKEKQKISSNAGLSGFLERKS